MTAIKGFPTSDKIVNLDHTGAKNEYATLQPIGGKRVALDTIVVGVTSVATGLTVATGSGNLPGKSPTIVTAAPHNALEGNLIRFTSGPLTGQEVAITRIVNPTTFEVGIYLPTGIIGSTFTLLSYVTPTYEADGSPVSGGAGGGTADQDVKASSRLDYAATNVTTGAWVTLTATVGAAAIKQIQVFESGGYTIQLGLGTAGSEVIKLLINPGGNGLIPVSIPAGTRVALRSVAQATINIGEIVVNYMG